MTDEQVRAEFEAWISAPPLELSISRYPGEGSSDCSWPGAYRDEHTYIAWEAWQAARLAGLREAATIAKQHEADYARTAQSEFVTEHGAMLHDAMSKGAANVATAILAAAGDET